MKDKLIEWIRQLLIKTVVPVRKKREEILSRFRFSMGFRISINYLKIMIIGGALFLVMFIAVFIGVEEREYIKWSKNIIEGIESGDILNAIEENKKKQNIKVYEYSDEASLNSYHEITNVEEIIQLREELYHEHINSYFEKGLSFRLIDASTDEVVYDDISFDVSENKRFLNYIYYDKQGEDNVLIISDKESCRFEDSKYNLYFQYNLTDARNVLKSIIPFIILIFTVMILFIVRFGVGENDKLLEPINKMSATANRLTVNNLHDERLNIQGTKNELKDLAGTINNMLDRLETSYESQKQFVSDASHELRTPIAVIQGYANLLDRWGKKDKDVMEESIEAIKNEAKAMQDLVEKLLFLSRHDKKTLKLTKTRFNMREVVEDMVKETKIVVNNRCIGSPVMEDVIVYGDKQMLKQAVRVFIDNAVKYTNDEDEINISCRNEDGDCIITVQDTGIGMTRKDVDNIFERFYRSDQVRNEKIGGHGLGLSIAKLIVLKHTGRIKVRSQFTKGTTFSIMIPKKNSRHLFDGIDMNNNNAN